MGNVGLKEKKMKRITVVFMSLFLILAVFMPYAGAAKTADSSIPIPTGDRLRDIVERNYPDGNVMIGATTSAALFDSGTGRVMDREFSYVTPPNDFKQ